MYDYLIHYRKKNRYPMHMPGHKRNPGFVMENPYAIDMTEVEGMDNLHRPEGIIRDQMNRIKKRYQTKESYLLVGGSTCGILAGISACCGKNTVVLVDRGCHRSVYHAIYLLGLQPVYLMPETDPESGISLGIMPGELEKKLNCAKKLAGEGKIGAVVITSPTYEGVVSDIKALAEIAHGSGIPVIVDEAHGAHLSWAHGKMEGMPESAVRRGADLVVQSLHKTLPALTQTALLHVCSERISCEAVERYLDIYETSSPSYILLASVDQCMTFLEKHAEEAFTHYGKMLRQFTEEAKGWQMLHLFEHPSKEPSKLVIQTGKSGLTGVELGRLLRHSYQIEVEMEAPGYVLAMTSLADSEKGFSLLSEALAHIDAACFGKTGEVLKQENRAYSMEEPVVVMGAYDAVNQPNISLTVEKCIGRISAEYAMIYPPGIPFLVPGERITAKAVRTIREAGEKHLHLLGPADTQGRTLKVLPEKGDICG